MGITNIRYATHTLNFWWGCREKSDGCANCYARQFSERLGRHCFGDGPRHITKTPWHDVWRWDRAAGKTHAPEFIATRNVILTMSMGDIFERNPALDEPRAAAFEILSKLEYSTILLLTKRPENILEMVPAAWLDEWPKHIMPGVTVENQKAASDRIPELLRVPAHDYWLSVEPLLENINFGGLGLGRINWVVVGGESGGDPRECNPAWIRHVVNQCVAHWVFVWVKQMGGPGAPREAVEDLPVDLQKYRRSPWLFSPESETI